MDIKGCMKRRVHMRFKNLVKAVTLLLTTSIVTGTVSIPKNVAAAGITLSGTSHVQKYGDISGLWDAESNTLTLKSRTNPDDEYRQIESITLNLDNSTGIEGSLRYSVYLYGKGWQDYKNSGSEAGAINKGLWIEGIKMELTGDLASQYTVEYAVQVQKDGFAQGFVSDGTIAGYVNAAKKIEEIKIRIVPAGQGKSTTVNYRVHRDGSGWDKKWAKNGEQSGVAGQARKIDSISLHLTGNQYKGGISYRSNVQKTGWESKWSSNGAMSGRQGNRIEGIQIKLTGEVAEHYDVYYRVCTQNYSWLAWAKNGESSGTKDLANRLEAVQVILVAKGGSAPGDVGGIKSIVEVKEVNSRTPILPGAGLFKMGTNAKVSYAVKSSAGWSEIKSDGQVLEVTGPITGIAVGVDIPNYSLGLYVDMPDFGEPMYDKRYSYDAPYALHIIDAGKRIENISMYIDIDDYTYPSQGNYDLYYRVKTSGLGWVAWTRYSDEYGGCCGTDEIGNTISAIQIIVMPKGQKPAADLNGITSDKEKPYYTMDDFPAPTIVTNGNKFAKWCLKTFPENKTNTAKFKYYWGEHEVIRASKTWKYRFGGSSKKGCDCSGFVVYVFRNYFHKKVYHGMHKLAFSTGKNISYSQMKPGDMLCDHSYHHGWVSFYVGKDSYGHEVVLIGHTDGTKYVVPTFEYWDIKAWAAEPKHSIRRR